MKSNEDIQIKLLANLSDINLDKQYYGIYEKLSAMKVDRVVMAPFSVQGQIMKVFNTARYLKKEHFYRCIYPVKEDEIWFHITANNFRVEFGLYIMSTGEYQAGGPMHGLAREIAQMKNPAFEYNPRYPRLPYLNGEMLKQALAFGYEILQEIYHLS